MHDTGSLQVSRRILYTYIKKREKKKEEKTLLPSLLYHQLEGAGGIDQLMSFETPPKGEVGGGEVEHYIFEALTKGKH